MPVQARSRHAELRAAIPLAIERPVFRESLCQHAMPLAVVGNLLPRRMTIPCGSRSAIALHVSAAWAAHSRSRPALFAPM
jgi:hypothetical protein